MKKILETLKQKFMNKFFWNLQIETVHPDINMLGEYIDGSEQDGCVVIRGLYLVRSKSNELTRRLELLLGNSGSMTPGCWIGYGDDRHNFPGRVHADEMNEKLKICFDIDFLSDKRWTRRYYVKLG